MEKPSAELDGKAPAVSNDPAVEKLYFAPENALQDAEIRNKTTSGIRPARKITSLKPVSG